MCVKEIKQRPTGQKRDEQMSHDQIMQMNTADMSRDQIASAINTLASVYIPNIVATFQHPLVLASYTDRLAQLRSREDEQNRLDWESEAALRRSEEQGMNQQYRATLENE